MYKTGGGWGLGCGLWFAYSPYIRWRNSISHLILYYYFKGTEMLKTNQICNPTIQFLNDFTRIRKLEIKVDQIFLNDSFKLLKNIENNVKSSSVSRMKQNKFIEMEIQGKWLIFDKVKIHILFLLSVYIYPFKKKFWNVCIDQDKQRSK